MKIKLAITGYPGVGKSTFSKFLSFYLNNSCLVEADKIGYILLEDQKVIEFIEDYCPEALKDGNVDRKILGDKVFSSSENYYKYQNFIAPLMIDKLKEKIALCEKKWDILIIDAALIYEWNISDLFDEIIYIYSDNNLRYKVLQEKRNVNIENYKKRETFLVSHIEKMRSSSIIIYSNFVEIDFKEKAKNLSKYISKKYLKK